MNLLKLFDVRFLTIMASSLFILVSCNDDDDNSIQPAEPTVEIENEASFDEIASITIATGDDDDALAEIAAYDAVHQRLFVTKSILGISSVDVLDFSEPSNPAVIQSILLNIGNEAQSVATSDKYLAIAVQDNNGAGQVRIHRLNDLGLVQIVPVGSLPDMVTFSPDGSLIVTANEGESSITDGSVSIIEVNKNFVVTTAGFEDFASEEASLAMGGFRIFGVGESFTQDIEPEYVTISADSKTAWVSLQENNGIARVDLKNKKVTNIFPLGFKDYGMLENAMDVSDDDGGVNFQPWANVFGMYQPDAIEYFEVDGTEYIISANEGDSRDVEEARVDDITLDASVFTGSDIQNDENLGRLEITTTLGDTDSDGEYEELYSYGARSFSIWNAETGALVYDSGNELDIRASSAGLYPDGRSDAKGSEPEGVTVGRVNGKLVAFIGLERADAIITYDISNPMSPRFLQIWKTGDAPEGVLFIPASDSPNKKSLLVVSSEDDGSVKVYQPDTF